MTNTTDNGIGRFPPTSSRAELAGLFGVSIRTISQLTERGVVVASSKRGQYETVASLHQYLNNLRETAAGRANDIEVGGERLRITTVSRKIAELKLAEIEGRVIPLDDVVEGWASILIKVKSHLLAIPTQLRTAIPHFGAHEQETAKELIRDVLNTMADEIELGAVGTHVGDLQEDQAPVPPRNGRKKRP